MNRWVRIQGFDFLLPESPDRVDVGVGVGSGVDAGAGDGCGVPEVWPSAPQPESMNAVRLITSDKTMILLLEDLILHI